MMIISAGYILKNIFLIFDSILVDRLSNLATLDLRKRFYRRTLRMDLSSFGEARVSELMSRFTFDIDSINQGIQTVIGRAIREPLKMAACLAVAAWICWRLLLVSLLIAPIAGYLISRLAKTLKRANRKALEEMSGLYNILSESFGGIKVVKAFTMERHERLRFHQNSKQYYRKAMKISRFDSLVHPVTELAGITMICLTILAGTYLGAADGNPFARHQDLRASDGVYRPGDFLCNACRLDRSSPQAHGSIQSHSAPAPRRPIGFINCAIANLRCVSLLSHRRLSDIIGISCLKVSISITPPKNRCWTA